jgi:hypothetical protein
MSVCYIEGVFKINGLELKSEQEMNELLQKMTEAVQKIHPHLRFDSDVDFDMDDGWRAGKFNNEPNDQHENSFTLDDIKSIYSTLDDLKTITGKIEQREKSRLSN